MTYVGHDCIGHIYIGHYYIGHDYDDLVHVELTRSLFQIPGLVVTDLPGLIVMAYAVMAYIVMAYIVMAYYYVLRTSSSLICQD